MTNVRARYDGRAYATSSHIEILEETEVKLSAFSIFEFPIYTLLAPQILHKPLFLNAPGSIAFSQEHFKTISYAKFGGQTECIMGNSKIVNIGGFRVTSSPPCWWTVNKRLLISSFCLSTSICSFHHCYLCLPRLHENHLLVFPSFKL